MKENNQINIDGNKKCNINVVVNQSDELSLDNINHNYQDVAKIEELFTDRLDLGTDILTKKLLPIQLQKDFEIVPKYNGNKVSFETNPITDDAYDKYPLHLNYTMKFDSIEEAEKFRKNGISELIELAEKTGKPVEIPNITSMKEFLGEFENPVGHANKYGSEGIKLYICPSPLPPAQVYTIDIFNSEYSFCIDTSLRLESKNKEDLKLTNKDSIDEPFNVVISLKNMKKTEEGVSGQFNINISLRDKSLNNCEYNLELIKYKYLIDDVNNNISITNKELNQQVFSFNNCGEKKHNKKEEKYFKRLISLLEKVIYIGKVKNINIKYDLDEFIREENSINIVYAECNNKNCTIKKIMNFDSELEVNDDTTKFCNQVEDFDFISCLSFVNLFGTRIELKDNELIAKNCKINKVDKVDKMYHVSLSSDDISFKINKNKTIK